MVATGRSDYPNQINNVLAFPGVFRGALDVRASDINEEMKMAAARALAGLIGEEELSEENIIPKPFDPGGPLWWCPGGGPGGPGDRRGPDCEGAQTERDGSRAAEQQFRGPAGFKNMSGSLQEGEGRLIGHQGEVRGGTEGWRQGPGE